MQKVMSKDKLRTLCGIAVFLFALSTALYFIWGPLFVAEFQADCADTLLWGKATVEAGSLVKSDFFYPYVIPFGGNVLMAAFIPRFGVSILTMRLAMTVFLLLLTSAFVLFFYTCVFKRFGESFFWTGCILMLLESNKKMREIMYMHIIHYSLAILFVLLLLSCLSMLSDKQVRWKWLWLALLGTTCFFTASEGLPVVILSLVPVGGAFVIERMIKKEWSRHDTLVLITASASMVIGLIVYYLLTRNANAYYGNRQMGLRSPTQYLNRIKPVCKSWLFDFFKPELYSDTAAIVVETSLWGSFVGIICRLFMIVSPFLLAVLSVAEWKKTVRTERIALLTFWLLSIVTVTVYIVGKAGFSSWRMIPMWTMMIIAYVILLRHVRIHRLFVFALTGVIVFLSMNSGLGVLFAQADDDLWYEDGSALKTLLDHGLYKGYTDAYLQVIPLSVFGDGKLIVDEVVNVSDEAEYNYCLYQNSLSDTRHTDDEKYFLLLMKNIQKAPEGWIEHYEGKTYTPGFIKSSDVMKDYAIYVYDSDPIGEKVYVKYSTNTLQRMAE